LIDSSGASAPLFFTVGERSDEREVDRCDDDWDGVS